MTGVLIGCNSEPEYDLVAIRILFGDIKLYILIFKHSIPVSEKKRESLILSDFLCFLMVWVRRFELPAS